MIPLSWFYRACCCYWERCGPSASCKKINWSSWMSFWKKKRKKLWILNPDQNQLICKATHILTDECLHFVNRGIAQKQSRSDMRNLDQLLLVMTITCGYWLNWMIWQSFLQKWNYNPMPYDYVYLHKHVVMNFFNWCMFSPKIDFRDF